MIETKIEYFIQRTEKDLDEIKTKLDLLMEFRFRLLGGAAVVSIICTSIFELLLAYVRHS